MGHGNLCTPGKVISELLTVQEGLDAKASAYRKEGSLDQVKADAQQPQPPLQNPPCGTEAHLCHALCDVRWQAAWLLAALTAALIMRLLQW